MLKYNRDEKVKGKILINFIYSSFSAHNKCRLYFALYRSLPTPNPTNAAHSHSTAYPISTSHSNQPHMDATTSGKPK